MTLVPVVDPNICAAHAVCVDIAPEVFQLEGDVATVIGAGPDDQLMEAAEACPSGAIRIVNRETMETVYP
jgi:ferredoxin